jgi:hypothetical protein
MEKMYACMEKRSARLVATNPSRSFLSAIKTSCKAFVLCGSSMAASIAVVGPFEGIIDRRAFNGPANEDASEATASSDDKSATLETPMASAADVEEVFDDTTAVDVAADVGTYPGGGLVYLVAGVESTALMSRASKLRIIVSLSPASVQNARKREMIWL